MPASSSSTLDASSSPSTPTSFLQPRPGTNVLVLNALAAAIIDEGLADETFIGERVDGFDDFRSFVRAVPPGADRRASAVCTREDLREAARIYATAKPAISFHGLGLTEHHQGTEAVMCLANLALLTGNLGRPGAGVNPLRGQNNVQGAAHMGCEPAHLPGYAPLADARDRVGATWGATIPDAPGLDAMEMLDAAAAGRIKGLWVVGWDLALTQPNAEVTGEALANLDLLVVQDLFLNETARRFATVFLPAASAFEKDGTFMNSERRVQRVRAAVAPPGDAKPDWEIVSPPRRRTRSSRPVRLPEPGRHLGGDPPGVDAGRGHDLPRGSMRPADCNGRAPTSTTRARRSSMPSTSEAASASKASLRAIEYRPAPEQPTDEFPLVLVTGRSLYQFNAGTMTGRSAIQALRPTDTLEVNAVDASTFGLTDGALVRVSSRYGEAVLPAEVSDRVPPGTVFATFNDPRVFVNRVTGPHRDLHTNTPDYKVTAVRVEPVRSSSPTPSASPTA